MHLAFTIIAAIFAIFSVVLLHEMGHFFVARWNGVKILRFSIGFGRAIWKYTAKKSGTEYAIGWLPLGGYVRMLGEDDEVSGSKALKQQTYNTKSVWQRMSIILAGPAMNFILALIVLWLVFLMGITQVRPVVGQVQANSIAAKAGLKFGDEVLRINGQATHSWQRVMMLLMAQMGDQTKMRWKVQPMQGSKSRILYFDLSNWSLTGRRVDIFKSLGFAPYRPPVPPVVAKVIKASPAAEVGLRPGDRILSINAYKTNDWMKMVKRLQAFSGQWVSLTVKRAGKTLRIKVKTHSILRNGRQVGFLGVMVQMPKWPAWLLRKQYYSILSAWQPAVSQVWRLTVLNFVVLKKMILGKLSVQLLGGPITIMKTAGQASESGLQVYLGFIAFISLTLGFINLLPIPGLDGGHFFFQLIEVIMRRPVPQSVQYSALKVGIFFLVALMLFATFNDVLRLF